MSAIRVSPPADPDSHMASDCPLELDRRELAKGIDWSVIFGNANPVELEIGCGKGMFITQAAATHPDVNWFGIDFASAPLRRAMDRTLKADLKNVRFSKAEADELLSDWTPTASLRGVHILYPDPWPKKRHHKRRLLGYKLGPKTLENLHRVLMPEGWLSVATDHDNYAEVIAEVIDASPLFKRQEVFYSQSLMPDPESPVTEFERKYRIEGRSRHIFSWRRV